jgi:hypothetical protein
VNVARRVALVLLCGGSAAVAQTPFRTISARAGSIGYQQGFVYVDDKRVHSTSGAPPFQMKNGQRLHIDSGRVELLLGSGVYLRMLGASSIRMQETLLADTRVAVEDGSAIIEVVEMNKGEQLRVICGESTTELKRDGLYRFDAPREPATGRLRIYSGDAAVERGGIVVKAKSGQAVDLAGALEPAKFDLKQIDPLHAWSAQRTKRRLDSEQRRMQTRLMHAARSKVALDERTQP